MSSGADKDKVQGEGDYDAAEKYNERTREFVESGKAGDAPDPAGQDEKVGKDAEREGKERAKELDPEVHRDHSEPAKPNE